MIQDDWKNMQLGIIWYYVFPEAKGQADVLQGSSVQLLHLTVGSFPLDLGHVNFPEWKTSWVTLESGHGDAPGSRTVSFLDEVFTGPLHQYDIVRPPDDQPLVEWSQVVVR